MYPATDTRGTIAVAGQIGWVTIKEREKDGQFEAVWKSQRERQERKSRASNADVRKNVAIETRPALRDFRPVNLGNSRFENE